MASLIFAHALSILLVGGLRFGSNAVLVGAPTPLWIAATAFLAMGMLLALRAEQRQGHAPWSCRGRMLLWLVFPGAAAANWGLGQTGPFEGPDKVVLAITLGLVLATLSWRRSEWGGRETSRRAWMISARWVLLPTIAILVAGFSGPMKLEGTGLAFVTYPLYAWMQLAAVVVLPWTQWARDDIEPRRRVAASALLFALVHWPNPFATVATGLGMLLWASAWRAGSALLPLALSLGIAATVATRSLPPELTAHMRVAAPHAIKARELSRSRALDIRAKRIADDAAWSETEGLRPWLARALPAATGRETNQTLVDGIARVLERMYRQSTLRWIFDSGEFRTRNKTTHRLSDDEISFFESTFVPFHETHAPYERLVSAGAELDYDGFVRLAYRELLGREPNELEIRGWPAPMSPGTRTMFIRRILLGEETGDGLRNWLLLEALETTR
jgi:hypothetical protein